MKKFREFMRRSSGKWSSQRRYIHTNSDKVSVLKSHLTVDFVKETDKEFQVNLAWKTFDSSNEIVSEGEMITVGDEKTLKRDVGYMSSDPTVCKVKMIDKDCVVFNTEYNGMRFREEIRLIENDSIRLRQTLGWKDGGSNPFLCGQYYEVRI